MSDAVESAQQDGKQAEQSKGQDEKQGHQSQDDKTVPYSRFKEVNDKMRELEKKEQERTQAEKAAQEAEAKKRGDFEKLISEKDKELEELRAFRQERVTVETAERESLLGQLSDEDKEIGSDLSLPKLRAFVNKQKTPSPPASPKGELEGGKEEAMKPLPGENAYTYGQRVAALKRAKH